MTGMRWTHVPFKGAGPNLVALMGGEIDFAFASTTALLDQARIGRIRAIAVTGLKRFGELRRCRPSPSRECPDTT